MGRSHLVRIAAAALLAAVAGHGVRLLVLAAHPVLIALCVAGTFAVVYIALAYVLRLEEARAFVGAFVGAMQRRLGRVT